MVKEIRALGGLICEFHAKDGKYMLGQGRIDFKEVRKAMDDIHYTGWIQIEAACPHGLIPDQKCISSSSRRSFPRPRDYPPRGSPTGELRHGLGYRVERDPYTWSYKASTKMIRTAMILFCLAIALACAILAGRPRRPCRKSGGGRAMAAPG